MSIITTPRLLALTAALTVGAAFVPTAASAASALGADIVVNALFTIADANGDGKIDATEAAALREKRFDDLDANHDGVIGPTEMGRLQQRAENRTKLLEDIASARFRCAARSCASQSARCRRRCARRSGRNSAPTTRRFSRRWRTCAAIATPCTPA